MIKIDEGNEIDNYRIDTKINWFWLTHLFMNHKCSNSVYTRISSAAIKFIHVILA